MDKSQRKGTMYLFFEIFSAQERERKREKEKRQREKEARAAPIGGFFSYLKTHESSLFSFPAFPPYNFLIRRREANPNRQRELAYKQQIERFRSARVLLALTAR